MRDFTFSSGCGCQVTFFAESEYRTSRFLPGSTCLLHTQKDQYEARTGLISQAWRTLAEYRHETETIKTYLMNKMFGEESLFCLVVDGQSVGSFTSMRDVLRSAKNRLGRITLPVWNCQNLQWDSEVLADETW